MIHESYPWKTRLYQYYRSLASLRCGLDIDDGPNGFVVEESVLMGAYVVRKLANAQKIPPPMLEQRLELSYWTATDMPIDMMNNHRLDRNYDFDSCNSETRDWEWLLNLIVHSYTLGFVLDGDSCLAGLMVNSDHTKDEKLYHVPMEVIFTILLAVSEGDIVEAKWSRTPIDGAENAAPAFSNAKLTWAIYAYPAGFSVAEAVRATMTGVIYERDEMAFPDRNAGIVYKAKA